MKKLIHILVFVFASLQGSACTPSDDTVKEGIPNDTITHKKDMKLKLTIGDKTATAVLYDNSYQQGFRGLTAAYRKNG